MQEVRYIEIEYNEWDNLVRKTYPGCSYECVAAEEWSNDSSHSFDITKVELLDNWDQEKLTDFKTGKFRQYSTHVLLQDMVNNGVLKPANYLIEVSW